MTTTVNLRPLLHRKAWEFATPHIASTVAGGFIDSDKSDVIPLHKQTFCVLGASAIWNYDADNDAWLQLPNSGAAGAFAAGACGDVSPLSMMGGVAIQSATGGTTTSITTSRTIVTDLAGHKVRVVAGTGQGYEGTITRTMCGANSVLYVTPANGVAFDTSTMFELYAGSLWFFNSGTTAVGFSVYDIATNAWTAKSVTGLPTAFGTDGQLVGTPAITGSFATGTALAGSTATTFNTGLNILLNSVANYQVRITAGTGIGQVRTIVSNTAGANSVFTVASTSTALTAMTRNASGIITATVASAAAPNLVPGRGYTISAASDATFNGTHRIVSVSGTTVGLASTNTTVQAVAQTGTGQDSWQTTPDATSVYAIEGNSDYLYLLGNNAVTMYRYSIGQNAWTTLAPTAARAAALGVSGTADWIDGVPEWSQSTWGDLLYQTAVYRQNGRYIYSFRGAGSSALDVYDIALNTWYAFNYGNQTETFSTGSCSVDCDGQIYIAKEGTGRIFKFDVNKNLLRPWSTNVYPQSTTVVGDKMFIQTFKDGGTKIKFLYTQQHSRTELLRMLDI